LFRGLMFEAEAGSFQSAGIQVGADMKQAEERLLSEALAPFNVATRNNALEMARLYALLHCFENEVRSLIRETLEEKEGPDWIDKLPQKTKQFAESRQKSAILSLTTGCCYLVNSSAFTFTLRIGTKRLACEAG